MKKKITYKLIGSASNEANMLLLLEKFFYTKIEIKNNEIYNGSGKINGCRVVTKSGRVRFEMEVLCC
jgi:hypothetical protein